MDDDFEAKKLVEMCRVRTTREDGPSMYPSKYYQQTIGQSATDLHKSTLRSDVTSFGSCFISKDSIRSDYEDPYCEDEYLWTIDSKRSGSDEDENIERLAE
ncbi:unnamed protein product [Angiostrongylus costaricensis]|uniref:Ovule protein n=1 Tax=Angiostrongylus costaricensis TaxID=334426 RepID=A0A0R3PZA0_ANGCS|nr:unnamed protein product [Angiostrongylus costaricensis]